MEANNMKAMREALVELVQFTCNSCQERFCESDYEEVGAPVPCSAILKARAALAAPPRNCDKYANHNDAMKAFEVFVIEQGKLGFINHNTGPLRWLFAPATEHEGGAK